MRILFLGSGAIALPALEWLIATPKHELVGVITQPDKPAGRRMELTPPMTKVLALAAGLRVQQPERIKLAAEDIAAFDADVFVVFAYGQILPKVVLEAPKVAIINLHTSLLPRHRGAAPIQAAIREGDAESGITVMHVSAGLDSGDIILAERTPLAANETGGSLHDRLADLAPAVLERALDQLAAGTATRTPQDPSLVTHIGKLTREHGRIDWAQSAAVIERTIRAYNPWPASHTVLPDGAMLKVHAAEIVPHSAGCPTPGTVISIDDGLLIACADGMIRLREVQREGGKRLPATDFLRGHPQPVGGVLT
jgi:methionyl-tRNA formyltransferase